MGTIPPFLAQLPEDFALVGDIEAFLASCEDGTQWRQWLAWRVRGLRMVSEFDVPVMAEQEEEG